MDSNIIGIGHLVGIGIGQCECKNEADKFPDHFVHIIPVIRQISFVNWYAYYSYLFCALNDIVYLPVNPKILENYG